MSIFNIWYIGPYFIPCSYRDTFSSLDISRYFSSYSECLPEYLFLKQLHLAFLFHPSHPSQIVMQCVYSPLKNVALLPEYTIPVCSDLGTETGNTAKSFI